LLVVTGGRCPPQKNAAAAVKLQAAIEPHRSRGLQPGGRYAVFAHAWCGASRLARGRVGDQAASASYASCRSVVIYITTRPPTPAAARRICADVRQREPPARGPGAVRAGGAGDACVPYASAALAPEANEARPFSLELPMLKEAGAA
jgi:hypothetical protein